MPELPEIKHLAGQMNETLSGRIISEFQCTHEKCLNMKKTEFSDKLTGIRLSAVANRGKWLIMSLDSRGRIALSLGMGGNVVFHHAGEAPRQGYRIRILFEDGSHLSVGFWWFGYFHYIGEGETHPMTDSLGPEPLDSRFTLPVFTGILSKCRGTIKSCLLNQKRIAGIGNFYIQDMLWRAGIHPLTPVPALKAEKITCLYDVMRSYLQEAYALDGASYERDLFDQPGRYGAPDTGYREGEPCVRCGTIIQKIKTGGTSSFICSKCQPPPMKEGASDACQC